MGMDIKIYEVAAKAGMMGHAEASNTLSVSAGKRLKGVANAVDRPRLSATGYHCIQYFSTNLETLYTYLRTVNPHVDCKRDTERLLIVLGHGRHEGWGLFSEQKKKYSKAAAAQAVYDAAGVGLEAFEAGGPIGLGVFLVAYPAVLLIQKGIRRKSKYKWWVRVVLCSKVEEYEWEDTVAVFRCRSLGGKEAKLRDMTEALPGDKVKNHPAMTAANVATAAEGELD